MASAIEQFADGVRALAADAEEQEVLLQELGTAPCADELGLVFGDAFDVVRETLPEPVRRAALQLDNHIREISGSENADLWTVDALHSAPEWVRVRHLARDVLRQLNEDDG